MHLRMFTFCFSLSLSCINWFHYNSTHDASRSIQKKFMLVRKRKKYFRILSHFLNATTTKSNIQRGQLPSVSYPKERFSLLFWFRNVPQPVFILPLNALQLVWFGRGLPPLHVSIRGLFWKLFALFLPCQELNWRADALNNTFYSWWDQRSSLNVVLFTRRP